MSLFATLMINHDGYLTRRNLEYLFFFYFVSLFINVIMSERNSYKPRQREQKIKPTPELYVNHEKKPPNFWYHEEKNHQQ
jgi:hypothetical protein